MQNSESGFPVYDVHGHLSAHRVLGNPTRLFVNNTAMYLPDGEQYAFFHRHLNTFLTVPVMENGVWQPQESIHWDFGHISDALGFGLVVTNVMDANSHPLLRRSVTWLTPDHEDYERHTTSLKRSGRFLFGKGQASLSTFVYPDQTIGYRLQTVTSAPEVNGHPYKYILALLLTEAEFQNGYDHSKFHNEGEYPTFFFPVKG